MNVEAGRPLGERLTSKWGRSDEAFGENLRKKLNGEGIHRADEKDEVRRIINGEADEIECYLRRPLRGAEAVKKTDCWSAYIILQSTQSKIHEAKIIGDIYTQSRRSSGIES